MRLCKICNQVKPITEFHNCMKGVEYRCKLCKSEIAKSRRESDYFRQYCITKRSECKRLNVRFEVTPEYLESIWSGICPVFGVEIERASNGRGSHNSAHLDKIIPNLGYIPGNVAWISGRANRIKYDATISELRRIADWMEGATTIPKGSTPEANVGGSAQPLFKGDDIV